MKRLKDVGFIQKGMVIVDHKGNKGVITSIGQWGHDIDVISLDNSETVIMMDWSRLRDDVYVEKE